VNGKRKRFTLGQYPHDLDVEEARGKASEYLSLIRKGKDPIEFEKGEVGTVSGDMTFGRLWSLYLERHAKVFKRSWKNDQWLYHKHLVRWESRRLSDITRADLSALMAKIGQGSGPNAANLVHSLARKMFYLAIDWGYEGLNPASRLKRFRKNSRSRYLRPPELKRFWKALEEFPDPTFRDFFACCLLTGQRRGNVQSMRWLETDLAEGIWTIPGSETKNGEEMRVILVPEVVELLRKRKTRISGEWVFPSKRAKSGHIETPKVPWENLCKMAQLEDLWMHDLRRTHGSWQAAAGASLPVIGKSLGHLDQTSTAIYARLDLEPVRKSVMKATGAMMEAVGRAREKADVVDAGGEREKKADVVDVTEE